MFITTITTKGQVVIPNQIRNEFRLKPSSKVRFSVEGDKIIIEPILSVEKAFGMLKNYAKNTTNYADKETEGIIAQAIVEDQGQWLS